MRELYACEEQAQELFLGERGLPPELFSGCIVGHSEVIHWTMNGPTPFSWSKVRVAGESKTTAPATL
jgi:hypothetical protein